MSGAIVSDAPVVLPPGAFIDLTNPETTGYITDEKTIGLFGKLACAICVA